MKKNVLLFPSILALSLVSCASGVKHDISEYILKADYTSNYRILQLTDVHLSDKDNLDTHFKFMDLTINDANPDMIIVTGDLFTFASKTTAKRFFDFIDGHGKPWTVTFGNHDEQCYFSVDWMTSTLNSYGSHCLFKDIQDDDVQGNANFAINLMQGDAIFEQLIVMDSNRYYYGDYFGYDCFKQNQIDWYSSLIDYTTEQNHGVVPSLMFYHIPLPEINKIWDPEKLELNTGADIIVKQANTAQGEKACPPDYDNGFFDVIKSKGSTTGMYFGHDHVNDFIVNYQGIDFAYGVKATDRIYYGESQLGGRVITLKDDHSVEYTDIHHTYAELEG